MILVQIYVYLKYKQINQIYINLYNASASTLLNIKYNERESFIFLIQVKY